MRLHGTHTWFTVIKSVECGTYITTKNEISAQLIMLMTFINMSSSGVTWTQILDLIYQCQHGSKLNNNKSTHVHAVCRSDMAISMPSAKQPTLFHCSFYCHASMLLSHTLTRTYTWGLETKLSVVSKTGHQSHAILRHCPAHFVLSQRMAVLYDP